MNALTAAQGELECAYDSIMDITDDAHVQLNHVVESCQDVTALEQEVTKYGCKQGEPVRNVARRLAADNPDRKSGSQQRAANNLIYSFAGAVNLDHP